MPAQAIQHTDSVIQCSLLKPGHRELFGLMERWGPVPKPALDAFALLLLPRTFGKGSWLLEAGQRAQWSFFIVEGLVRELYLGEGGEEHTRTFMAEGQITGSLLDLMSGLPSVTSIQALEATATLAFPYREFDLLTERHPALQHLARRIAENLYVRKAKREHEMLALTAKDRHARWLAESSALDHRISRQHLASYLGVTPEHLSRLRRRGER